MYLSCDYCERPVSGEKQINTVIEGLGMTFCNQLCYETWLDMNTDDCGNCDLGAPCSIHGV